MRKIEARHGDRPLLVALWWFGTTESGFGTIVHPVGCAQIPHVNLTARLLAHPSDETAIVCGDRRWSRAELGGLVARARGGLAAAGVTRGQRVGLLGGHDERFIVAHLAIVGLGAVSVPLNPRSPTAELRRELTELDLQHLVLDSDGVTVEPALLDWSGAPSVVELGGSGFDALTAGESTGIVECEPDDPAVFLLTSGTAGPSRPAVLTHTNLSISLDSVLATGAFSPDEPQAVLCVVPMFHVFGLNVTVHLALAAAATIVLTEQVDGNHLARLVTAENVTILPAPPNLWAMLAEADGLDAASFSSVKIAFSGAARLDRSVRDAVEARLGLRIAEGYGLTETSAILASSVGHEVPVGSVGPPMPGVEVRLVDETGADVLIGDVGEVWVRGPMVSPGYWTADGLTNDGDWFRTGDLAVVNDDGFLSIVDRIKDLIIVSGFNVHPIEVERALVDHPAVARAAVVSEPDDRTGECVVAHVVPARGHEIDVAELIRHCDRQLARYKVPRRIEIAHALPETAIGKVKRREL